MTYKEIEAGADLYGQRLAAFVEHYRLPEEWFGMPDHIAVKCSDRADFDEQIELLRPFTDVSIMGKDMHGRTLGTVELAASIMVGSFGEVNIIEVMEPRPEKAGVGLIGFEHMEFTYDEFAGATYVLGKRGIEFNLPDDNPAHQCIDEIIICDEGFELKLNDRPLVDIIKEETSKGKNYEL